MNIYNRNTIIELCKKYPDCKGSLESWYYELNKAYYKKFQDIKKDFASASFVRKKYVCFNIKGNTYRLICSFNYPLRRCFIKWFGTHEDYDKLDIEKL